MISSCERWAEPISALASGPLSAGEAAEVGSHLAECPRCARELEANRAIKAAVRRAAPQPAPLPTGFWHEVQTALDAVEAPATKRPFRRRWTWAGLVPLAAAAAWGVGVARAPVDGGRLALAASRARPQRVTNDPSRASDWLNARLGLRLDPVNLSLLDTQLMGAGTARSEGYSLGVLLYRHEATSVTFFALNSGFHPLARTPVTHTGTVTFHRTAIGNQSAITWQRDHRTYGVVGSLSQELLLRLAREADKHCSTG